MDNNDIQAVGYEELQIPDTQINTRFKEWQLIYKLKFQNFLCDYGKRPNRSVTNENDNSICWSLYEKQAIKNARYSINNLTVNIDDIFKSVDKGVELASFITENCSSLALALDETVNEFVKITVGNLLEFNENLTSDEDIQLIQENLSTDPNFYCSLVSEDNAMSIKQLRCEMNGKLVVIQGTVGRLSGVYPQLRCATFKCLICNELIPNVQQEFTFSNPTRCVRRECKNMTSWELMEETCQFTDWQKFSLQENSDECKAGSIPRSLDIILTRHLCDCCKTGDKIRVTGYMAVIPDVLSLMNPGEVPRCLSIDRNIPMRSDYEMPENTVSGFKGINARDLSFRLVFIAQTVKVINTAIDFEYEGLSNADAAAIAGVFEDFERNEFEHPDDKTRLMEDLKLSYDDTKIMYRIANSEDTLSLLAQSVAPEIFRCDDVKKGILLMIVGGVEKITKKDNLKLRGDINMCIVGDPGTAKSLLLKCVQQLAPKTVYTSGITSSAAGLTVTITKDPDQRESVIEAGALMLADEGICCIDEFDTMKEKDRVALHETMEQQTISICKGGVQATLNARASVLAACNPCKGFYDVTRRFRYNVSLSAPIISRFDLIFILLDLNIYDEEIATHLIDVQTDCGLIASSHRVLSKKLLSTYLMIAKCKKPKLTEEAKVLLVKYYVGMRLQCIQLGVIKNVRITVRSLESLIRMSEAVAKLKFVNSVTTEHVKEAFILMQSSMVQLERSSLTLNEDSIFVKTRCIDVRGIDVNE